MSKTEENLIQLTQAFDTGPIYLSPAHFNFRTLDTIERHDKHNETRIRVRLDPAESVAGEPVRGYRSYFVRESPEEVLRLLTVACGEGVTAVAESRKVVCVESIRQRPQARRQVRAVRQDPYRKVC